MLKSPLTPELFASWLSALRSGRYRQGKSCLVDGDSYCCLGVLNEIAGNPSSSYLYLRQHAPIGEEDHDLFLPQWLQSNYAQINDKGKSFAKIADALESDDRIAKLLAGELPSEPSA